MYFIDTGLAAYLCRWPNAETLENGAMDGAIFVTYVVTEIVKSYYNAGKHPDLYYYRDIDGKKIDLLIIEGTDIYPIKIKKSKNPSNPDKNFNVLDKLKMNIKPGLVICMANKLLPFNRDTWFALQKYYKYIQPANYSQAVVMISSLVPFSFLQSVCVVSYQS